MSDTTTKTGDPDERLRALERLSAEVVSLKARNALAVAVAETLVEVQDASVAYRKTEEDSDEWSAAEVRWAAADKAHDAALAAYRALAPKAE